MIYEIYLISLKVLFNQVYQNNQVKIMVQTFYVLSCSGTIELWLRRTLERFDMLLNKLYRG